MFSPLRLIERYLLRQFATSVAAVALVLLLVSLGGLFADLMSEIARGKVPAALLLSQLGLRTLEFLPLVLPLAIFVGLLMVIGRLYAQSEMAVLASLGLGSQQLWRPLALVAGPIVLAVALISLWLAPWSARLSKAMIEDANRSFLVAGLEAGRFVELPGRAGVLYVGSLSPDGTRFSQLFVQSERNGRLDVITAKEGELAFIGETGRYLHLREGFRVEGAPDAMDFRMMRFAENEVRVPDREREDDPADLRHRSSLSLLADTSSLAQSELHWRLGLPLLGLVLAAMALPLGRSQPREPRYVLLLVAALAYLGGMMSLIAGKRLLAEELVPAWLGLWWLWLPAAVLAVWMFRRDGRLPSARPAP